MKNILKIAEMVDHCPSWLKDAFVHVAKDSGLKTDDLELHRHSHSEKSATNQINPKQRQSLKYVSARTQDRDDEIVIPRAIDLKEFRKYMHVLVNHNYSLLPVGSDETIEADDFGIKALTNHADTGEGTLANVIWHLVSQGHMKSSSVGFVPTSYTKPGARDWDTVANKLQSSWKEFDKSRAEKSISRIITGGVLLEHSFVSVPCNADAEMISVVKGMVSDDAVLKQLGWEPAKLAQKNMGGMSASEWSKELSQLLSPSSSTSGMVADVSSGGYIQDIYEDYFVYGRDGNSYAQGYSIGEDGKPVLNGKPTKVERRTIYVTSDKSFDALVKAGISLKKEEAEAVPCVCGKCGAKRECPAGEACAEEGCDGKMKLRSEEKSIVHIVSQKEEGSEEDSAEDRDGDLEMCECSTCGTKRKSKPDIGCAEEGCKGTMVPVAEEKQMVVKVVHAAPTIKVLYTPPDAAVVAKGISEAVERALNRRLGKVS